MHMFEILSFLSVVFNSGEAPAPPETSTESMWPFTHDRDLGWALLHQAITCKWDMDMVWNFQM